MGYCCLPLQASFDGADRGSFPFIGSVRWLAPDQGGRRSGVPPVRDGVSDAHVGYVPPRSFEGGAASFDHRPIRRRHGLKRLVAAWV